VGSTANEEETSAPAKAEDTNTAGTIVPNGEHKSRDAVEISKDHGDDGGEESVGEEDTVIY